MNPPGFASFCLLALSVFLSGFAHAATPPSHLPETLTPLLEESCMDCHDRKSHKGGLDLTSLSKNLLDPSIRERWIRIHDRVEKGEMPPRSGEISPADRQHLLDLLSTSLTALDQEEIASSGRGPLRRLNRIEYERNLRELLQLPHLEVLSMLPEDRESRRFCKTAEALDMSRVQLTAYLDAAAAALRQATVSALTPPPLTQYRAVGTRLFPGLHTFGTEKAMFFARNNRIASLPKVPKGAPDPSAEDTELEMALFRSASWPYAGNPKGFLAKATGEYRVRFSARAVVQLEGLRMEPANRSIPMTFRARKPTGVDVFGEVRATGGILDIQPEKAVYETTVFLKKGESIEYSLLGLPMPLVTELKPNTAPEYRFPPFPEGGQPGAAFQFLEIEGPLPAAEWPPHSHRVLWDQLAPGATPESPTNEARRLLRRFVALALGHALPEESLAPFEGLAVSRLEKGVSFQEAMLAAYQAFLSSGHFLYLREPGPAADPFPIASRLSYFLTNQRPDEALLRAARQGTLRSRAALREQATRLIEGPEFRAFVDDFTDSWLGLRHLRRDEPDMRLYPEYRMDDYLVESMEMETRAFFAAMIRENLPATALVQGDFCFVNDRLAEHYGLPGVTGSQVRKVSLPSGSPYGGLLTQASVLKVSANGSTTSPVIRGAWVMERLLGQPPPPPPPSVPAVEPDIRGAKTIRDLLALHTQSKECASCHAKFDPVGLALENFDVFGAWRSRYRGLSEGEKVCGIDRTGKDFAYTLAAPVDASGSLQDGSRFQNIHDLKRLLAGNPRQLARNLLHQFTIYGTGTPVRFSERAHIEAILNECAPGGYRVRDLLLALIESPIFVGSTLTP
ncbi:MAG: hypothetical protein RLZZ399_2159 [Verrucomicrobiota bacterium]|jgi:hypothetical protein